MTSVNHTSKFNKNVTVLHSAHSRFLGFEVKQRSLTMSIPLKLNPSDPSFVIVQWIYFSVIILDILILVPFGLYYAKKIWTLRNGPFFSKRFPKLTISTVLLMLPYHIIIRTLADLPRIIPPITLNVYIRLFCYNLIHIVFVSALLRIWFMYYNYSRGVQMIYKEFHTRVDELDIKLNWAINPKYHFLSPNSNFLYYASVAWVIFVEVVVVLSEIWSLSSATSIFFYVIVFIVCVIIGYKIRSCRDELALRKEAQLLGCLGLLFAVFYAPALYLLDDELKALSHCILISIAFALGEYIMLIWVLKHYQNKIKDTKFPRYE